MSLSEKLNSNPAVAGGVAGFVLLVAVYFIFSNITGSSISSSELGAYFWDLENNQLVVAPLDAVAPYELENGQIAVEAGVFACGDCPKKAKVEDVLYVRRMTEKAKAFYMKSISSSDMEMQFQAESIRFGRGRGWEIAQVQDGQVGEWVSEASPQGQQIMKLAAEMCGGDRARACNPS